MEIVSNHHIARLVLAFVFTLLISSTVFSQPPEWYQKLRQIKPMVSTRQDLENLFNSPEIERIFEGEWYKEIKYKIKDSNKNRVLFATYSQG